MTVNDRELALRPEDVRAAQMILDVWLNTPRMGPKGLLDRDLLDLRGLVSAQLADVRTAGYLEGLQVGRREAGQLVLECLRDEGLA